MWASSFVCGLVQSAASFSKLVDLNAKQTVHVEIQKLSSQTVISVDKILECKS